MEGEALGMLQAIKWLTNFGLTHVILEMDCKFVVDKINTFNVDTSEIGSILLKCKQLLVHNPSYMI